MAQPIKMSAKKRKKLDFSMDPELGNNRILRRYLDLPKFVALLRSASVYLQRVDLFPDKLEGVLPPGIRMAIDDAYSRGVSDYDSAKFLAIVRRGVYLNCWSSGAKDNMALWKLYGSPSMGVVITTTTNRLIDAALEWSKSERIQIFRVRYIDHAKNPNMIVGAYSDPLRFKHVAYSFEREVRVVLNRIGKRRSKPDGVEMPISLNSLVRSVVVAPEAPTWFFDLVTDLSARYGLAAPVRRSALAFVATGKFSSSKSSDQS